MTVTGIAELTLESRDVAALERFYTDGLGLRVISRDDDRIWLAAGRRARIGLCTPGEKEFFERSDGRRRGVEALTDDAPSADPR